MCKLIINDSCVSLLIKLKKKITIIVGIRKVINSYSRTKTLLRLRQSGFKTMDTYILCIATAYSEGLIAFVSLL